MSAVLLQKLVNNEINFYNFKQWILSQDQLCNFNCSQNEFLTYFLNFVHEDISIHSKSGTISQTCTPRKIKPTTNEQKTLRQQINLIEKSSTFPGSSVKSLDKSFVDLSCNSNVSTPKCIKNNSDSRLNLSYYSPVSPLYSEHSFNNSKGKKHTVCLGDFVITNVMKPTKKKTPLKKGNDDFNKRITPTSINNIPTNEAFKSSNSFNEFNTKAVVCDNVNTSRMNLAKERLKFLTRNDSDDRSALVSSRKIILPDQREQIEPQLDLITYKNELTILSDIYILILKNNMVLNITGEIYFLTSLLVSKQYISDQVDDPHVGIDFLSEDVKHEFTSKSRVLSCSDYFDNIHNVLYFAVRCLESQFDILKYYDKTTLKMLSFNKRIKEFSIKFSEKLRKCAEKKLDRIVEIFEGRANVGYNLDTDSKDNFPNDVSFLSFRKQRDLFYDILRIWEKNHIVAGWNFQIGVGGKIKTLLGLQADPTNFMHFCRLFKAQLLSSCGFSAMEEGQSEEDQFPINFPSVDPNKLCKLKNRLTTKQSSNGLNSPPHFSGHQEFFKEFIVVAANHSFNIHLQDTFVSEIVELNKKKFVGLEESDSDVDASTRKSYDMNMRQLRVLAKFLGFVESMPYKSDVNSYPENLFTSLVTIREKQQIEEAFFNGQPESLRKTVEFVSERLASACVKHICNAIVPPFKKDASLYIKEFLDTQKKEIQLMSPGRERNQKTVLKMKISQLAQEYLNKLHQKCFSELSNILRERIPVTLENLLALDTLQETKTTCISIAARMCKDRLKQWIGSHMTVNIFLKDFEKELHKMWIHENKKLVEEKTVFALPSDGRTVDHYEHSLSAFHVLENIKILSVDILERSHHVNRDVVTHIVIETYRTLTSRCDVNDVITVCICNSLLELALLLITHRPDIMYADNLTSNFTKVWQWYSTFKNDLFSDILSPKNVTLINQCKDHERVWKDFARFVAFLIHENVLICDKFETQCTAFFRKEWEEGVLKNVCYCIKHFVEFHKENGGDFTKFIMLLDFLADSFIDI
ncbi:codanin-1 isoform X2 [Diabrotica virgifera virgifera]|uniref:Codanin-1 C-terminal domain-containing protein n=1 Tax=Diabrotica virgifera virgifera TaxID=50390 RepID=A0ABM5JUF9_DIAVI|nr:codanin-1 isoform X2 [Diabrotica virgifera virgifera]